MIHENVWTTYDEKDINELEQLSSGYIQFLNDGKTERECAELLVRMAEENGYRNLGEIIANDEKLEKGSKVYAVNMGKAVMMLNIGDDIINDGMNILGAHIDSPRLDIKQNPLYESDELAYFNTHYYGGVKKYHYVALPLALHGVVCKTDGTTVRISIGEDDRDPVFFVSDLLIHLAVKGDELHKEVRCQISVKIVLVSLKFFIQIPFDSFVHCYCAVCIDYLHCQLIELFVHLPELFSQGRILLRKLYHKLSTESTVRAAVLLKRLRLSAIALTAVGSFPGEIALIYRISGIEVLLSRDYFLLIGTEILHIPLLCHHRSSFFLVHAAHGHSPCLHSRAPLFCTAQRYYVITSVSVLAYHYCEQKCRSRFIAITILRTRNTLKYMPLIAKHL